MPLYDCMLLLKPHVKKEGMMDLVARVGKHVYSRNGVVTGIKSFGNVQLGYGIKKRDGRHYQGQLMQMTMMTTPNINKELLYLNKEDRLLRWLLVKHRDTKYGLDFLNEEEGRDDFSSFQGGNVFGATDSDGSEDSTDYSSEESVDEEGEEGEKSVKAGEIEFTGL